VAALSKDAYEAHAVKVGQREGRRYAERQQLQVPYDLAIGRLERLSDLQVREAVNDLLAEQRRRKEQAARAADIEAKCGGYDPFASQIRRSK
jgi:hypothetical protein